MFYIKENENIVLFDEDRQKLETTILFTPQYKDLEILETEEGQVIVDFQLMTIEEAEQQEAQKRELEFKSQFFKIPAIEDVFIGGFYRKRPKGYSSAVESLNSAFNGVTVSGGLPANTLIFYAEPDYTDPEQCTEEWLVDNQFRNEAMTPTEFGQFYATFMQAWNTEEHE